MATMAMRRHAAQQALAMVVAGMDDPPEPLIDQLLNEVDDIGLVVGSLVGMVVGLIRSVEEKRPGTAERFLHGLGLSLQAKGEDEG